MPDSTEGSRAAQRNDPLRDHPSGEEVESLFAITGAPAAELEAIVHSMPDAIYIGGTQGIKKANHAALSMLGFETVDDLNRHIATLAEQIMTRHASTGKRIQPADEPFARALRGESVVEEVIVRHLKTHKDVYLRCAAAPVIFDGKIIGAVAINTDITQNVTLLRKLKEANHHLEQANSTLQTFGNVVTHDLKEPVRAMEFYLTEARSHAISPEAIGFMDRALEAHGRLSRQLTGLLEFSRMSLAPFTPEPMDVEDVLKSEACRGYYAHMLSEHGARLDIEVSSGPVLATPLLLSQALGNLVLNALKHNPGSGLVVRVSARPASKIGRVEITVEDNGSGYSSAALATFRRQREEVRSVANGFGLTIVAHAVEKMGGTLDLGRSSLGGARAAIDLESALKTSPAPSA